ncbi:GntR family transcriptional regulator [Glaciibacter flavus]|uniref:GntR family transcriptional regulator n=1 Tax=Orlajensenia flava TaxID=2565934 RepID=UPI003AFF9241
MPLERGGEQVTPERASLSDLVFSRLSGAIIDGTLAEGEVIRDAEVAGWLGVSRTPVREAIARLSLLGLVESEPSRYTRVTRISDELVAQTLEFTGYQASLAVRLAVMRMSDDEAVEAVALVDAMILTSDRDDSDGLYAASRSFVGYVTARSGNAVFSAMIREAGLVMERNLRSTRPVLGDQAERGEWYRQFREAICERDADYAEYCFRRIHHLTPGERR